MTIEAWHATWMNDQLELMMLPADPETAARGGIFWPLTREQWQEAADVIDALSLQNRIDAETRRVRKKLRKRRQVGSRGARGIVRPGPGGVSWY